LIATDSRAQVLLASSLLCSLNYALTALTAVQGT
jgi:hypothetical protein